MKCNSKPYKTLILALSLMFAIVPVTAQQSMPGMSPDPAFTERERKIMPFSLTATLHTFTNTADGGTEAVKVKNPKDRKNIALIRSHLLKEAKKFGLGDFSDPAYLHGKNMPGIILVSAGAKSGRIKIMYSNLPTGAQLRYKTSDPKLVKALHIWFEAQVKDHGHHATMGR